MIVRTRMNGGLVRVMTTIAPPALLVAVVALIACAAPAGEPDESKSEQQKPQWRLRGEIRAAKQLHIQVGETLDLNREQTEKIDKLFADRLVELEALIKKVVEQEEDSSENMERIRKELKAARDSSDAQRLRELRDEMRGFQSAQRELRDSAEKFDGKVIAELSEEQANRYRRLAGRLRRWTTLRSGGMDGMRGINYMLRQVKIDKKQMDQVRDIARKFGPRFNSTLENPKARRELVGEYREEILKMLTDEQRGEFLGLEEQNQVEAGRTRTGRGNWKKRPPG